MWSLLLGPLGVWHPWTGALLGAWLALWPSIPQSTTGTILLLLLLLLRRLLSLSQRLLGKVDRL